MENQIDVLSNEEFSKQLESIENNPIYYKCDCYWLLSKMRHDGNYSTLHSIIDQFSLDNDCMKFFLNPEEYENKNEVDVEWILTTRGEGVPKLATIPEYKAKLKQYLIDNKFLRTEIRNNIVSVL